MQSSSLRTHARFFILIALLAASLSAWSERVADLPRPSNYVNDFAGVLSPGTQRTLNTLCSQLDRQAHAQIAVITIKSLDGEPIESFATALEDKWGVGGKKSDRGVLLILAVQDRKRRIEVGYGLEGILPDSRAGEIGRAMVPDLQANDYNAAVTLAVNQMAGIIARAAGVTLQPVAHSPPVQQAQPVSLGKLLILAVIGFFLIIFLLRRGGSGILGFLLGMFFGGGGGWGGGGRGGGSGGGGGDGGFGGFGGGESGGGGASGDW